MAQLEKNLTRDVVWRNKCYECSYSIVVPSSPQMNPRRPV